MKIRLTVLASLLSLVGCAGVVSVVPKSTNIENQAGLSYSLPLQLYKLHFSRTSASNLAATKSVLDNAKNKLEEDNLKLEDAKARIKGLSKGYSKNSSYDAIATEIDKDEADIQQSLAEVASAKEKYDRDASAMANGDKWVDKFTLTSLPLTADPRYRYIAKLNHMPWSSDDIELKTTSGGLLTSGDAKLDDQTSQIVVAIAGAFAGFPIALSSSAGPTVTPSLLRSVKENKGVEKIQLKCPGPAGKPPAADDEEAFEFDAVFDPTNSKHLQTIANSLCRKGARYGFKVTLAAPRVDQNASATNTFDSENMKPDDSNANKGCNQVPAAANEFRGLCYRRSEVYIMDFIRFDLDRDINNGEVIMSEQLELPNQSQASIVDLPGTLFSKNNYKVAFENGMLVSHQQTRPSEILGVASLPVDVMKAIISVPTELVKLRIDYKSDQTQEINAQTSLIKAQTDLLAAKKQLSTDPTPGDTAAP